jgi:hypothetical protein
MVGLLGFRLWLLDRFVGRLLMCLLTTLIDASDGLWILWFMD